MDAALMHRGTVQRHLAAWIFAGLALWMDGAAEVPGKEAPAAQAVDIWTGPIALVQASETVSWPAVPRWPVPPVLQEVVAEAQLGDGEVCVGMDGAWEPWWTVEGVSGLRTPGAIELLDRTFGSVPELQRDDPGPRKGKTWRIGHPAPGPSSYPWIVTAQLTPLKDPAQSRLRLRLAFHFNISFDVPPPMTTSITLVPGLHVHGIPAWILESLSLEAAYGSASRCVGREGSKMFESYSIEQNFERVELRRHLDRILKEALRRGFYRSETGMYRSGSNLLAVEANGTRLMVLYRIGS